MKDCEACNGHGVAEATEDCWSVERGHFTIEYGATCAVCDGTGRDESDPAEPGWLAGTPEGACDEPTNEDTARLLAHFTGGVA
jgi:hypothetical protein